MDQLGKWEDYIHLVEFAYNNNYQSSLKWALLRYYMADDVKYPWVGVILTT